MGLAALQRDRGELDLAIDAASRAVELVESMRASIPDHSDRTHFLQIRSNTYRILAASLADRDPSDLAEPFFVVERAHARTLREVLAREPASSISDEFLSLSAVQHRLAPGDLLLEFLLGEEESSLMAIDAERATFHALPPRRQIEERIEAYRRALLRPLDSLDARLNPAADFRRFAATGHELYRDLLGPVAERLEAAERLIIVPDRQLHLLPFEALLRLEPEMGRQLEFLGATRTVTYLPAAALLAEPGETQFQRVVVVAADRARADLDLAPLLHAVDEVRAVRAAYPEEHTVLLAGDSARMANLVQACSSPVDVLHLTAHAVLDAELGPRIALHGSGEDEGWLDAEALDRLPEAPKLAILSACDTARGELVGGEGILGLVRAFTLAGSRQVVASLWKVDDERTSALMGRFHEELRGGSRPSAALMEARRELLAKGFEHPFYWAGLVLYGSD
jgi:CHAT domain-containing protein